MHDACKIKIFVVGVPMQHVPVPLFLEIEMKTEITANPFCRVKVDPTSLATLYIVN